MQESNIYIAIITTLSIALIFLLVILFYFLYSRKKRNIIKKAHNQAKKIRMDAFAEAQFEAAQIIEDAKNNKKTLEKEQERIKDDLTNKQQNILIEIEKINKREKKVFEKEKENIELSNRLNNEIEAVLKLLEESSKIDQKEAEEKLMKYIEFNKKNEINSFLAKEENEAKLHSKEIVNKILVEAMQKLSIPLVSQTAVSYITLESDDLKGNVIGKEGRNIRAFEQYGGVDIIIDETPKRVGISSFNPIRREVAVRALEKLLLDKRMQPIRIEEELLIQRIQLEEQIVQIGQDTIEQLGILEMDFDLIKLIGKLKYRTSYSQNVLLHSIEVAQLSGTIASALGLDTQLATRAGLLHDIGKALDFEIEGSHVTLGVKELTRAKENPIIINAVHAHHEEVPKETVYAEIIAIADTISASRPGARISSEKDFFVKMNEIEEIGNSIEGVLNTYALQSGRQIRVMVNPDLIDDYELSKVLEKLKSEIMKNLKIPGDIVITVIREKREVARIEQ